MLLAESMVHCLPPARVHTVAALAHGHVSVITLLEAYVSSACMRACLS